MISNLRVKGWKNYKNEKSFSFKHGINFIVGPNGIGKTSLLQAIEYGYTGSQSQLQTKDLVNWSEQKAEVTLEFQDSSLKQITRSLGGLHQLFAEVDSLTCPEYLGIPTALFHQVIYISEGEIYRLNTVNQRTKNEIRESIQRILQLDLLTDLINLIGENRDTTSKQKRELQSQVKELKEKTKMSTITKDEFVKIDKMISALDSEKSKLQKELESALKKGMQLQRQKSVVEQYRRLVDSIRTSIPAPLDETDLNLVGNVIKNERATLDKQQNSMDKFKEFAAITEGKLVLQRNIVNVISDFLKEGREGVCPVCHRSLSTELASQIMKEIEEIITRLEAEKKDTIEKIEKALIDRSRKLPLINNLETQFNNLLKELREMKEKGEIIDLLSFNYDQENQIQEDLIGNIRLKLSQIEGQINDLKVREGELRGIQKLPSLDYLDKRVISLSQIEVLSDFLEEEFNEIYNNRRRKFFDSALNIVNDQLKGLNMFEKGRVILDENLLPAVQSEEKEISFDTLSGGEKSIIYLFTRCLLNHLMSGGKLLLIDEPLEHLDSFNRRMVLDFLFELVEKHYIQQLVVTTYEETLTRKYINRSDAHYLFVEKA